MALPATAFARGHDASALGVQDAPAVAAPQMAIADQIDALLASRISALTEIEGNEPARRQALSALSTFAVTTVEGLIAAAPDGETRMLMDERLRPILARHQATIDAALAELGQPAPVRQDLVQARASRRFAEGP